jgi:hypothetical protein
MFDDDITTINPNTLDIITFTSALDSQFRNGFWIYTSLRFFYIHAFMKKHNVEDVIHLENDVLVYYNIDQLIFPRNAIYLPFDTRQRNIASIVYIPKFQLLEPILKSYNSTSNDMQAFHAHYGSVVDNFPIFIKDKDDDPLTRFVSHNYSTFGYIFDAAAIGQYLGGIDPRNDPANTVGFINETCVIKYDNYTIVFTDEGRPQIVIDGVTYPIFNLHIHSKNLNKFILKSNEVIV